MLSGRGRVNLFHILTATGWPPKWSPKAWTFIKTRIWDTLGDLVLFVQFKKHEEHQWRSVTFSKVASPTHHKFFISIKSFSTLCFTCSLLLNNIYYHYWHILTYISIITIILRAYCVSFFSMLSLTKQIIKLVSPYDWFLVSENTCSVSGNSYFYGKTVV